MKIKTYIEGSEEVELPEGYDYSVLREKLENASEKYKSNSEELEKSREKKTSPFEGLDLNGNPFVGRPTLSEEAPIFWYRSLIHTGMRNFLRKLMGEQVDVYLYQAGKEVGRYFVKSGMIEKKEEVKDLLKEIHEKVKALKIGRISVLEMQDNYARIRVDECISCAGMLNTGEMVCFWEGGVIAGLLSKILEQDVEAVEYKCWANGEEVCEFDIFIGKNAEERCKKRHKELDKEWF